MSQDNQVPVPWHADPAHPWDILGPTGQLVATCVFTSGRGEANARLIVSAVNAHAALLALALAYGAWEADLILNGDWSGECVRMTQAQHDRMLELQAMRNAAVAQARKEGAP